MDKVFNLDGNRGHGHFGVCHHFCDQTHKGVVTHCDDEAFASARLDQGSLEHQVFGLQGFFLDVFSQTLELHGLAGQAGVVHLQIGALNDPHVCGDAHTLDQVYDVAYHDVFGQHSHELAVAQHSTLGGHLVFE